MEKVTITAFRSAQDVARVRRLFYDTENIQGQIRAIEEVAVWRSRGRIPHGIDSTAQIVSVMVQDAQTPRKTGGKGASPNDAAGFSHAGALGPVHACTMRLAYASALVRFVNGMLDPFQDGAYAAALSELAKNIGLPYTFVEIRHSSTHDRMPSLETLRIISSKALEWLDSHFWQVQEPPVPSPAAVSPVPVHVDSPKAHVVGLLRQYKKTGALAELVGVADDAPRSGVLLRLLVEKVLLKDAPFAELVARNGPLLDAMPPRFLLRLVYAMLLEPSRAVGPWVAWLVPKITAGPFPFVVGYEYVDASSVREGLCNYRALLTDDRARQLSRVLEGKAQRSVPSLDDLLRGDSSEAEVRVKRQKTEVYSNWVPVPFGMVPGADGEQRSASGSA